MVAISGVRHFIKGRVKIVNKLMVAAICFLPSLVMADEIKVANEPNIGLSILAILILVSCAAVAFGLWNYFEWIGAKRVEAYSGRKIHSQGI